MNYKAQAAARANSGAGGIQVEDLIAANAAAIELRVEKVRSQSLENKVAQLAARWGARVRPS